MKTSDRAAGAPELSALKQQARRLREAMAGQGTTLSHGQALELVARQHGARDWNTLVAALPKAPAPVLPLAVGQTVSGRYLGQAFTGKVLSLTALSAGGLFRVTLHFDQPVDVVTFESFSAFRQRVTATVDARGISPRQTSNGLPQMIIEVP